MMAKSMIGTIMKSLKKKQNKKNFFQLLKKKMSLFKKLLNHVKKLIKNFYSIF